MIKQVVQEQNLVSDLELRLRGMRIDAGRIQNTEDGQKPATRLHVHIARMEALELTIYLLKALDR